MRHRLLPGICLIGAITVGAPAPAAEQSVTVFAAASLKGALGEIGTAWAKQGHPELVVSLDSSGTLAKQIEQGAPAQIFLSADEKWMDYLAKANLIVPATRRDLLTNTLVLIRPADHPQKVTLAKGFDLGAILGPGGRLSVGDTQTVPAGIYARQALTKLGVWEQAQPRLAPAANVKAALLAVETGEAPAGIVYATDAKADKKVALVGTFPSDSHEPITYPIALVATSGTAKPGEPETARQVLAFLTGRQARAIYAKYGFGTK